MMFSSKTWLLLFVFTLCCFAGVAQPDVKVTAQYSNESVAHILKDISSKNNVQFAFDSYELSKIKGTWSFSNKALEEVLSELLLPFDMSFKWTDDTYVIFLQPPQALTEETAIASESLITRFGEVRDIITHELLPFAVLSFRENFRAVSADADGKFMIEISSQSSDTLDVFFVGYELLLIPVKKLYAKSTLVIYLTPARNFLPDVLVQAESIRSIVAGTKSATNVINPGNMAIIHGTGEADVFRAVQILPGVSGTQESSNGLYIRGGNNDQTLISFDGFTLYHQDHFFGAFSAINANAVKTIRVHKGATDARFGGRAAGILEVIGKEGNFKKGTVQLDLGALSVGACIEAPTDSSGKSGILITARKAFTNAIYTPTFKSLFNSAYNTSIATSSNNKTETFGNGNDPSFYFQDINVKFTYRPTSNDVFNLSVYGSKDKLYVNYADTLSNEVQDIRDVKYSDESTKLNTGLSLRWVRRWNNKLESLLNIGKSKFSGNFFSTDTIVELLFQNDTVRFSAEETILDDLDSRFEFKLNTQNQTIVLGTQINRISSFNKRNESGQILLNEKITGNVFSFYLTDQISLTDRFLLIPGLRANYYDRTGNMYPEPRFSLSFEAIKSALFFKMNLGRVHQFVQRIQTQNLYQNTPDYWKLAGDHQLQVLRADQISAGFNYVWKNWVFDLEGYYKASKGNTMSPGIVAGYDQTTVLNGRGRASGFDALLQYDRGRHHFIGSYSLMKAIALIPELDALEIPEVFEQRHELKCNYELKLKKWDFSLLWLYGSGRPYTPLLGSYAIVLPDGSTRNLPVYGSFNSARMKAYHRLDVGASYNFVLGKMKATLQVQLFNTYGRKNTRNIQYLTIRNGNEPNDYTIAQRNAEMLGFLPTINLRLKF